jgi:hypothetical protein
MALHCTPIPGQGCRIELQAIKIHRDCLVLWKFAQNACLQFFNLTLAEYFIENHQMDHDWGLLVFEGQYSLSPYVLSYNTSLTKSFTQTILDARVAF